MDKIELVCPICGRKFYKSYCYRVTCSDECKAEKARQDRKRYYQRCVEKKWNIENPDIPYDERPRRRRREEQYIPKPRAKEYKYKPGVFDAKLRELKAQGLDYIEEQKKDTIERYARITL